jgi:hypothetical protein
MILYIHRISDNRVWPTVEILSSLCGQQTMSNVKLAVITTMWNHVAENSGSIREKKLKKEVGKVPLLNDCRIERFDDTYESAWRILGSLDGDDMPDVLLLHEIFNRVLRQSKGWTAEIEKEQTSIPFMESVRLFFKR